MLFRSNEDSSGETVVSDFIFKVDENAANPIDSPTTPINKIIFPWRLWMQLQK